MIFFVIILNICVVLFAFLKDLFEAKVDAFRVVYASLLPVGDYRGSLPGEIYTNFLKVNPAVLQKFDVA